MNSLVRIRSLQKLMRIFLPVITGLFLVIPVGAEEATPSPESIPAGKGSVETSGKFVPNEPQPANRPVESREQIEAKLRELLHVTEDAPHCFRIGKVSFNRELRTVTIPAVVNMDSGVVEYGLVAESGKVHEALFVTAAKPEEIHLACLLLGVSAKDDAKATPAEKVKISVTWETNGPTAEHELAHLVMTVSHPGPTESSGDPSKPEEEIKGTPLTAGAWTYEGSVTDYAGFAAAREGSIISLISDPAALITNPRDTANRDDSHHPNKQLLPNKGDPVSFVLTFPSAVPKATPPQVRTP